MTGTTETFYKREVERHQFFKLPQWLFKAPYNELSNHAKLMYSLLYDRMSLSILNSWHDKDGKIFIYFTNEHFCEALNCSEGTVIKTKKELTDCGLISEARQGLGMPNRIYLYGPSTGQMTEGQELQNLKSRTAKTEIHEQQNLQTNQTDINQTDINHNYCYKGRAFFDVYQERIGPLDGEQFGQLKELIDLDGMEVGLLVRAIGIAADNSKRNFKYIMAILKNWKRNGLLTLPAVEEADRAFQESKVSGRSAMGQSAGQRQSNIPSWSNPDYQIPKGMTEEEFLADEDG